MRVADGLFMCTDDFYFMRRELGGALGLADAGESIILRVRLRGKQTVSVCRCFSVSPAVCGKRPFVDGMCRSHFRRLAWKEMLGLCDFDDFDETTVPAVSVGGLTEQCEKCGAHMFAAEAVRTPHKHFALCCLDGKMSWMPRPGAPPPILQDLLSGPSTAPFRKNIRFYNSALGFTSFGAALADPNDFGSRGPPVVIVHGHVYHYAHTLFPGTAPKYAQLYMYDTAEASVLRAANNPHLDPELLHLLAEALDEIDNPYVRGFRRIKEILEERGALSGDSLESLSGLKLGFAAAREGDTRRYNAPQAEEVAVCFESADGAPPSSRDIVVWPENRPAYRIADTNDHVDPLTYPLLFPRGDPGWTVNLKHCGRLTAVRNNVTCGQFYKMKLAIRDLHGWALPHSGGLLFQQYLCDMYCRMEAQTLYYLRQHQTKLRKHTYAGLQTWVGDRTRLGRSECSSDIPSPAPARCGTPVMLPSTFKGSPRQLQQNLQDALTIVRRVGRPDYFVTFTANPSWPEIREVLDGTRTEPSMRPDLVARVFWLRLQSLLKDLVEPRSGGARRDGPRRVLGRVLGYTWVVEFQKRGLPHAHILLIMAPEDRPSTTTCINAAVCAELPPDAEGYSELRQIVIRSMIHGPCGHRNPRAPCMVNGKCSKGYPKDFQRTTLMRTDAYPLYRRRDAASNNLAHKGVAQVDDRDVVPYNPFLLKRYDAHLNVEVTEGIRFVKYMYKYTYKGHDRARLRLGGDEIESYVEARYVGPCEAAWRLFQFPLSGMSHTVIRLDVHLPDEQSVIFREGEEETALFGRRSKSSTLLAWFAYNTAHSDLAHLRYTDFPQHCRYDKSCCSWIRRTRSGSQSADSTVLCRLYTASPHDGERFYLYLLLLSIAGAKSFDDLYTFKGVRYAKFREVCVARNLVDGDREYELALEDAATLQSASALRVLFALLLIHGDVSDPLGLWKRFIEALTEDLVRLHGKELGLQLALSDLQRMLSADSKSTTDFGLPAAPEEPDHQLRALSEAQNYDPVVEGDRAASARASMTSEQAPMCSHSGVVSICGERTCIVEPLCISAAALTSARRSSLSGAQP